MADRKKNRRKFDEDDPPTKEDYAVAKFLRFNVATREAKLHNMEVQCFFASAAIDALLDSKWSTVRSAKEPLFFNRHSCISYCQRLITKGMFHRAERVQRKKDKEKDKGEKSKKKKNKEAGDKEETGTGDELKERKGKKDKKGKKEKEDVEKVQSSEKEGEEKLQQKEEKKEEGKKKKEKRLKLVMTDDQKFVDGEEHVYVWVYDPVNAKTLIIGSLIVLGAIALCLFPLWPEIVRIGVYYVSLAAAGFVGFILSLVVVRLILFCCIWLITLGRHHFWLLPNLTEDVGFFESFRPLYKHDVIIKESSSGASKDKSKSTKTLEAKSKSQSKKKEKSSDKEDSGSEQEEFEMVDKGDVEEEEEVEEGGEKVEGDEDTEDNGDAGEEEEEGPEDEDYDDDEEEQNGNADEEDEDDDVGEEDDGGEEEETELKKDK